MVDTDVFIAGGGPAGLAAAMALRSKGLRVMVADGSRPPLDKACGEGLMPDSLAAARSAGIHIPRDAGFSFRGIRFSGKGGVVDASFPEGEGLGIKRTVLHSLMVEQAQRAGVDLRWGLPVTGIDDGAVFAGRERITTRWIIGADGGQSSVRRWANLDATIRNSQRYAFRRHYQLPPWTRCMEIHWGEGCQFYVTPVSECEVCVVLISRDPHLRIEEALTQFPALQRRLREAPRPTVEKGAATAMRQLWRVASGCVALIGDASGSVDAITGEGLCLSFRQAVALAEAIERGNLSSYRARHRRLALRPAFMADFMLLLDRGAGLRRRALAALAAQPHTFANLLAMHVGMLPPLEFARTGLALGLGMLTL